MLKQYPLVKQHNLTGFRIADFFYLFHLADVAAFAR